MSKRRILWRLSILKCDCGGEMTPVTWGDNVTFVCHNCLHETLVGVVE
jgi:hypothetical protein